MTPDTPTHTHHWILEKPVGDDTRGRCKFCQQERVFHEPEFKNVGPMSISRHPLKAHRRIHR